MKFKRDIDVIRENHKFLWDDEEPSSWEEQLAKKYYDRLYKEYCIADLRLYKEGKVGLRWQIEAELVTGKGQFMCGEKSCNKTESLRTWEVNFGYIEQGEKKNALVKLRLCKDCSYKLNYKHKRKEIKRIKKRKHRSEDDVFEASENTENLQVEHLPDEDVSRPVEKAAKLNDDENNIWKTTNRVTEEKSRDEDFEEFLEQLLL